MDRNSSLAKNQSLEYPAGSPGGYVRLQRNYARHGILATALLLGLTLVMTTWFAWRNAEALTDTVSEGQGELYLRVFHEFNRNFHPDESFRSIVQTYGESGLRAAGRFDSAGNFKVIAGAFEEPVPNNADRPEGRVLVRVGDRYRIIVHLPPGGPQFGPPRDRDKRPGGFPPRKRRPPPPEFDGVRPQPSELDGMRPPPSENAPPIALDGMGFSTVAFEFEPLLATGLTQRARMTFFLATGVAALLAIAAVVLWRRAEREEALGARLMQAERLASLGTMSAVLAHEIKNPLASLKGNAQLLAESLPADGRSRSQADRVVDAALRLQGLVQNLLDFARGGPIERTEVDPAELLFLAAEDAAPATTLDLDQAPPTWSLDAIRMRQVLENLLRNALQASKHGVVKARVFVESNVLVYVVDDDGPGFPADVLENVFEPFFTTKSRGVGLGLAVARRIVFMHGGTITARNKTEGGAELKVSIPQIRNREESSHGADSRGG